MNLHGFFCLLSIIFKEAEFYINKPVYKRNIMVFLKSLHCDEALMSFSYFVDNDDVILRCLPSSIAACLGVGN